ncbi:MAG: adenylosuccinate synthetase [Candidatus Aenigmarchaeota archaeon]|nr:adenylosuccinate synthetase [Candidatus Aenigmarchaeota archaeon]
MTVTAIFGMHWGDEGKGKIVDILAEKYDIIVRYNGGDNAGHTVVTDEEIQVASHNIPSSIRHDRKVHVIGNGEVVNLNNLLYSEIEGKEGLLSVGVFPSPERLVLSDRAHLILPYYSKVEERKELSRGIGTTRRGIGVAYMLKADRTGIRVLDLLDDGARFIQNVRIHADEFGLELDPEQLLEEQRALLKKLQSYLSVQDTVEFFRKNVGANVLLEGAQAVLLDLDAGTYPYVTSSSTVPGGSYTGALGIPPIDNFIGVMKAYVTRVGAGPFPTELGTAADIENVSKDNPEVLTEKDIERAVKGDSLAVGKFIRAKGKEYGASTGRPRRAGWQDLVVAQYALNVVGGPQRFRYSVAVTKLDILDGLPEIKVCTRYGKTGHFPSNTNLLYDVDPQFETLPGWNNTSGVTDYKKLDGNAKAYIEFIHRYLDVPVSTVSTGPKRGDTIQQVLPDVY